MHQRARCIKWGTIGDVGLHPYTCTWTGGFKAVGKTAEIAMGVWEEVKACEELGAFDAHDR